MRRISAVGPIAQTQICRIAAPDAVDWRTTVNIHDVVLEKPEDAKAYYSQKVREAKTFRASTLAIRALCKDPA